MIAFRNSTRPQTPRFEHTEPIDKSVIDYWLDRLNFPDLSAATQSFPRVTFDHWDVWRGDLSAMFGQKDLTPVLMRLFADEIDAVESDESDEDEDLQSSPSGPEPDPACTAPQPRRSTPKNAAARAVANDKPVWVLIGFGRDHRHVALDKNCVGLQPLKLAPWLAIPARLSQAGELLPPLDQLREHPFIPRSLLEPQPRPDGLYAPKPIGSLLDWEDAKRKIPHHHDWASYANAWLSALTRLVTKHPEDPSDQRPTALRDISRSITLGNGRSTTCYLRAHVVPRAPGFATRYAVSALTELKKRDIAQSPVLDQVFQGGPTQVIDSSWSPQNVTRRHAAMVAVAKKGVIEINPLNLAQRRAVHAFLSLDEPGLVSVSGPPGTGKTAMLRAMIASQWTRAAAEGTPCPITICCGATNQSVENVLGTFDGALFNLDPKRHTRGVQLAPAFSERWLKFEYIDGAGEITRLSLRHLAASAPSRSRLEAHLAKSLAVLRPGEWPDLSSLQYLGEADGVAVVLASADGLDRTARNWLSAYENAIAWRGTRVLAQLFSEANLNLARGEQSWPVFLTGVEEDDPLKSKLVRARNTLRRVLLELLDQYDLLVSEIVSSISEASRRPLTPPETVIGRQFGGKPPKELKYILKRYAEKRISAGELAQAVVDLKLRPEAFQLAIHIWEAEWLIASREAPPKTRLEALQRAAMLFPCMVSTLHAVPNLVHDPANNDYCFGAIDLVVIDEAGQASPELAAPALAFAKKAVVVGDLKQLEPVSQFEPAEDLAEIADKAGKDVAKLWRERGALASTGSAMQLAATAASFKEPNPAETVKRYGLLLREHFRCPQSIISVCVDLIYHDHDRTPDGCFELELEPIKPNPGRGDLADVEVLDRCRGIARETFWESRFKNRFPLPPLGFFMTGSINDEPRKTDSWVNDGEARALVEWLSSEGPKVARWMARQANSSKDELDLSEVFAILSPFRGQIARIKELIVDKFGEERGKRLVSEMKIGTVHTLQGGERPVVLFSAVNATMAARNGKPTKAFIDRDGGRLLNVAVSRAQQSFILFGHADLFFSREALVPLKGSTPLPSQILGRCMAGVQEPERALITGLGTREGGERVGPHVLLAVESPVKAASIQNEMPALVQVVATGGHIRDLATLDLTPENGFTPEWTLLDKGYQDGTAGTENRISALLDKIASRLLHVPVLAIGTDPDPQGEVIAWHLLTLLRRHPFFATVDTVARTPFSSPTQDEVTAALANPFRQVRRGEDPLGALNLDLVRGAVAQRVIDGAVGGWWKREHGIEAGRVTAPLIRVLGGTLAMDSDRYQWTVEVEIDADGETIPARLVSAREREHLRLRRFLTERGAAGVAAELQGKSIAPSSWELLGEGDDVIPPPRGLGTADVIRLAWKRHQLAPQRTARALQELHEGGSARATRHDGMKERLCALENGYLHASDRARELATRLAQHENISSLEFAAGVERWSADVAASRASYEDALRWLSETVWGRKPGYFGSYEGRSGAGDWNADHWTGLDLAQPSLHVSGSDVIAAFASIIDLDRVDQDTASRIMEAQAIGAAMAHPPIMLQNAADPLDAALLESFSADATIILKLIRARTLATLGEPASVRRSLWIVDTPLPGYRLTVQTLKVVKHGWLAHDPAGWHDRDRVAKQETVHEVVAAGRSARVFCSGVAPAALPQMTPDGLLDFMLVHRLGRPRTYATHLSRFIPEVA